MDWEHEMEVWKLALKRNAEPEGVELLSKDEMKKKDNQDLMTHVKVKD